MCKCIYTLDVYLMEKAEILQSVMWWVVAAENFRTLEKFLFSSSCMSYLG